MEEKNIKTCDLVKELQKREGVKTIIAEPYQGCQSKWSCNCISGY